MKIEWSVGSRWVAERDGRHWHWALGIGHWSQAANPGNADSEVLGISGFQLESTHPIFRALHGNKSNAKFVPLNRFQALTNEIEKFFFSGGFGC